MTPCSSRFSGVSGSTLHSFYTIFEATSWRTPRCCAVCVRAVLAVGLPARGRRPYSDDMSPLRAGVETGDCTSTNGPSCRRAPSWNWSSTMMVRPRRARASRIARGAPDILVVRGGGQVAPGVRADRRAASAAVNLDVRTTPEADDQVRVIDGWWQRHRIAVPTLFLDELEAAFSLMATRQT